MPYQNASRKNPIASIFYKSILAYLLLTVLGYGIYLGREGRLESLGFPLYGRQRVQPFERYLVYSSRDDGFNNQLDQFRLAVCAAYRSRRTLVLLPLWYDWTWDVRNETAYRKFGDFFDISTLSQLLPTIELDEFIQQRESENAEIDVKCDSQSLKETILQISAYATATDCDERILNSTTIQTIGAFGSLTTMCGDYGSPHAYRRGNEMKHWTMHWLISTHLTFSAIIESYASSVIEQFSGLEFVGIHVRLGDYQRHHCKTLSFCPQVNDIVNCIKKLGIYNVFLATNPDELLGLKAKIGKASSLISVYDSSNLGIPAHFVSAVEQAVCRHASMFVGSSTSSWSQLVFDLREASYGGSNKSITWNHCVNAYASTLGV